jgi:hypothetical protein
MRLKILCLMFILLPCLAVAQRYSADGDTMYIGDSRVIRNRFGTLNPTPTSEEGNFPGLITTWGPETLVSDRNHGRYFHPIIVASDSFLHVFTEKYSPTPDEIQQYLSSDNGQTWQFYAGYYDSASNITPLTPRVFCENNSIYTVWLRRYGTEAAFTYFRASSDYGRTWPITARIEENTADDYDAKDFNVSGHGDTVFVSFREDSIACWRSVDRGRHWRQSGFISGGVGNTYPPSLTYKAGVVHLIYNNPYRYNEHISVDDVYYIRSTDKGIAWSEPVMIGRPDYADGQWPEMAADNYGNVAVCWMDYWGTPYMWTGAIYCIISHDSGQTWEDIVRLDSTYLGNVGTTVAIDGDYVAVAWAESPPNPYLIFRESYDGGLTWGPRQHLSQADENYTPMMIKYKNDVHLVWEKRAGWNDIKYLKNEHVTGIEQTFEPPKMNGIKLKVFPNPFNGEARFSLDNYKGGEAKLKIYDVSGRLVGFGHFDSNGATTWGKSKPTENGMASGVYFAVATGPFGTISTKILYLK